MHDDIQTMRLYEMDKCIKDLQLPCRWVPDMGYGYGYPQFNYYAPLPYYVMEVFHLFGISIISSVKIGFGLSLLLGVIGMYLLGNSIWKSRYAGLLSALFYTYFPYHAVDIYVRGAMGEAWALSAMPFIFLALNELVTNKNKKGLIYLAISIAVLMTSHNVSTLIFIPFCILWFFYLIMKKSSTPKLILKVSLGVFWGFCLSAFFILPAWFEKKYVHVETITEGYFNFLAHFVGLRQLLLASFWGFGSSELGDYDRLYLGIGPIWWITPLFIILFLIILRKKELNKAVFITLLGWFAIFMIHPKSVFVWQKLYLLSYVQFPWRFLGIGLFMFSLASGSFMLIVKNKKLIFILFAVVLIGLYSGFFTSSKYLSITDRDKFSGDSWVKQQTISIFDYLPIYANQPPSSKAPDSIISNAKLDVIKESVGSNWRNWQIIVYGENAKIELPILYFPGWQATDNGNKLELMPVAGTGLISANIKSGNHELKLKMSNTPIRTFSNIISLIAILLILIYKYKLDKSYDKN
jgi:hypothetical protein